MSNSKKPVKREQRNVICASNEAVKLAEEYRMKTSHWKDNVPWGDEEDCVV